MSDPAAAKPVAPFLDRGDKIVAARVSDSMPGVWVVPESGQYVAKADETPAKIAHSFGVSLERLVRLNQARYPTLLSMSKLKGGTVIDLPPRDLRWMLTRQISKMKDGKKKKYTVQDVEVGADGTAQIFENIESKRVQEYPQLNNTYKDAEIVLALWPMQPEHADPGINSHWLTEFSTAIYLRAIPNSDPPMAVVKFENEGYTLDHSDPSFTKSVPLSVIIKREKEKHKDKGPNPTPPLPDAAPAMHSSPHSASKSPVQGVAAAAAAGAIGQVIAAGELKAVTEINIIDPDYPDLGMRRFLYDSQTKYWHDSMTRQRQIRFRVVGPAGSGAAASEGRERGRGREEDVADNEPYEEKGQEEPPKSPPRFTADMIQERLKAQGLHLIEMRFEVEEEEAEGEKGGAEAAVKQEETGDTEMGGEKAGEGEKGTEGEGGGDVEMGEGGEGGEGEEERPPSPVLPCMRWTYTDGEGRERYWHATKNIDSLREPAPYIVLW